MTIKDIAKEAGCGVGTVSRVLNNHPDVSEKTREKILEIVNRRGFVINANARQLKAQDRKSLAIIVKGTSSILLNRLLELVQKKMESLDYVVSVFVLDESDNEGSFANRIYYEYKPTGIVFLGGSPDKYKEDFQKIKVPCVLISTQAVNVESDYLSSVSVDNFKASYASCEYLIKNGHRKIGVIGGNIDNSEVSRMRFEGFLEAAISNGITFDFETMYETSKYNFEGGALAVQNLIKRVPGITAVFTMSDAMAIGACRKLKDLGYDVPNQISIVGFDGISLCDYYNPRLTTIRQIPEVLVDEGLDILLNCIERKYKPVNKLIPFEFIKGESVKKI